MRGDNGRWLQGNPGGAGNPFARQVAAVRQRLYDRVTPEMMDELIDTLGQTNEPGALASYALALLAAGRTEDACTLQLDASAGGSKRAALLVPAYCAALSGDTESAVRIRP